MTSDRPEFKLPFSELLLQADLPIQKSLLKTLIGLLKVERSDTNIFNQKKMAQLYQVCKYLAQHSPHFQERLTSSGLEIGTISGKNILQSLEPLSRQAIQSANQTFFCKKTPASHGHIGTTSTSGSSGEPVVVRRSMINQLFWMAYTVREHLWFKRNFSLSLAIIRASDAKQPVENKNWGSPTAFLYRTGKSYSLPINTNLDNQLDWLVKVNPNYLLTYPTNLNALVDLLEKNQTKLSNLREIRTIGETLTPELISKVSNVLKIKVCDSYSSQEIGYIAQQCPEAGLYHIIDTVIVEVVDEFGRPCQQGEIGRIIVSDLINYASPLIRYDIGDFAEVGPDQCRCGRPSKTLKRIYGRERNMLIFPDGKRHWPLVGFQKYREIASIRQYQLIQRDRENIDVKLVVNETLDASKIEQLRRVIQTSLGYQFNLNFILLEEDIPRSHGGKFEEFICLAN